MTVHTNSVRALRSIDGAKRDRRVAARGVDAALKRALDVSLAAVLLLLSLPVLVGLGVLVVLDSPGPALFACPRVGRRGRRIRVLKFRKMRDGAVGPALTVEGDERLTRIGAWLAATKLDELPQLWNVLRGDMSLVGPRPEDSTFVALRRDDYLGILDVKPGMTGLSQLAFFREREILAGEDALDRYVERILPEKIDIDLLYARRRTIGLDVRILLWTAVALILRRELAIDRVTGRPRLRRGPGRAGERDRRRR